MVERKQLNSYNMKLFKFLKVHFSAQIPNDQKIVEELVKTNNSELRPTVKERIIVLLFTFFIGLTICSFLLAAYTYIFVQDKSAFFIDIFKYCLSILVGYFMGYNKEK
jgi:hypothetical protein